MTAIALEPDGIDVDALGARSPAGCGRSSRTSSPTSTTRPATRCRGAKRERLLALAREHGFIDLRGRPLHRAALPRRARCRRCSRWTPAGNVVYASSFSKTVCPGIRVGYLVGPRGADRADRRAARRTPTSRRAWSRRRSSTSSAAPARSSARSRRSARRSGARRHARRGARARAPGRPFVAPDGGYFLWVELPDGTDVGALFTRRRRARRAFVSGEDFVLDGGGRASARVLRRDARRDPRGREAARGGVSRGCGRSRRLRACGGSRRSSALRRHLAVNAVGTFSRCRSARARSGSRAPITGSVGAAQSEPDPSRRTIGRCACIGAPRCRTPRSCARRTGRPAPATLSPVDRSPQRRASLSLALIASGQLRRQDHGLRSRWRDSQRSGEASVAAVRPAIGAAFPAPHESRRSPDGLRDELPEARRRGDHAARRAARLRVRARPDASVRPVLPVRSRSLAPGRGNRGRVRRLDHRR